MVVIGSDKGTKFLNFSSLERSVGQPLPFPESPVVSFVARDLTRGLLVKEQQHRLAYKRRATEIKQHLFFEGVNWELIRFAIPPNIPKPVKIEKMSAPPASTKENAVAVADQKSFDNYLDERNKTDDIICF